MIQKSIILLIVSMLSLNIRAQDESGPQTGYNFGTPDFHFTAGTGMSFNTKDLLFGFTAGGIDVQNLWSAKLNFDFRPFYKKVIQQESDQLFYQYREKRYFLSAEINKYFTPLVFDNTSAGIYLQSDQGFYLGSYKGTNRNPESSFVVSPGGGIVANVGQGDDFHGVMFTVGYNYFKTKSENIPDGQIRIDISLNF